MKILSWNVRGLRLREKNGAVRRFIRKNRAEMFLIQETKRADLCASFSREILGSQDFGFFYKSVEGSSSGQLVMWNSSLFKESIREDSRSISVKGQLISEGVEACFTNIYGPNTEVEREAFWVELDDIHSWSTPIWCLGRDFNVVRFTWSNNQARGAMSRLDIFLTSSEWYLIFTNISQIKLFSPISDHCPVLLDTDEIDWGPKPFCFSNAWLEDLSLHSWSKGGGAAMFSLRNLSS